MKLSGLGVLGSATDSWADSGLSANKPVRIGFCVVDRQMLFGPVPVIRGSERRF